MERGKADTFDQGVEVIPFVLPRAGAQEVEFLVTGKQQQALQHCPSRKPFRIW